MRIGIDLGGTKIEGVALDDDGRELARKRVPTPRGDYPGTVSALVDLVTALEQSANAGRASVGIGIPGTISPRTGLVKNANATWIVGKALDLDVGNALGREVRLANDANCFAVSEAKDGAGKGARCVFGVIIGTGCGGGFVVDGAQIVGANAVAGEWGHNSLPWPRGDETPGPACYCGRSGCIETFLSGTGFARDHLAVTGVDMAGPEIVQRAAAGDAACEESMRRYEERLARALAGIINIIDPDVIVLGGGMSKVTRLYAAVPLLWDKWVFSDHVDTKLRPPVHGDASGVRGAAWLWPTA